MLKYFFIFFVFLKFNNLAQQVDSLKVNDTIQQKNAIKKTYSKARRAAIYSACLPGLGQGYNKKYFKIPIIYAGIAGFGYMFYANNKKYNYYRSALLLSINNNGVAQADGRNYSTDQLQILKLDYKKYRDYGVIGMGIIYLLNIIDANVDGHLKTFDVSDDLSLNINPWQNKYYLGNNNYKTAYGLSLTLNFK